MRIVRTGQHQLTGLPDVTHCTGCGQPFEPPHYTMSSTNCLCTDCNRGHRVYTCTRDRCHAESFDPECVTQTGPTGD